MISDLVDLHPIQSPRPRCPSPLAKRTSAAQSPASSPSNPGVKSLPYRKDFSASLSLFLSWLPHHGLLEQTGDSIKNGPIVITDTVCFIDHHTRTNIPPDPPYSSKVILEFVPPILREVDSVDFYQMFPICDQARETSTQRLFIHTLTIFNP